MSTNKCSFFEMETLASIEMKNISFRYGQNKILENFNLNIEGGKTYCLVGSSGSGKTTTLRLINGLLKPNSGEIYIDNQKFDFSKGEEWRRSMGYSIQGSGLFPHMTVEENLSIIARKEKWSSTKIASRIQELCELTSLPYNNEFLSKKPRQISGGQQQRVGMARALFMNPKILLMDEPFSALDPITRSELQKEFLSLQAKLSLTIVLVTHDLSEAFSMADEIVLLNNGKIEQKGKPSKFLLSPSSDFVENFVKSHSPGNILKEVYLYSVVNPDIYVSTQNSSGIKLTNLESSETHSTNSLDEAKSFLKKNNQNAFYWATDQGQFKGFQEFDGAEKNNCLASTQHILFGMKEILKTQATALPVTNDKNEIIGVFSEEALNAL